MTAPMVDMAARTALAILGIAFLAAAWSLYRGPVMALLLTTTAFCQ